MAIKILPMEIEMTERLSGTVVFFAKGFGFVTPDDTDRFKSDIFVHFTQIEMDGYRKLLEGQRVSFELGKNHRGIQAERLRLESEPEENK